MTTTIDYYDGTMFPQHVPRTIGRRDKIVFYAVPDGPLVRCRYLPSATFEAPARNIGKRPREPRPSGVPGPGAYSPGCAALVRNPAYSFSGPKFRDDWLVDTKASPSPDQYTPTCPRTVMPHWSLGGKSRPGSRVVTDTRDVFAIGNFLVKLDASVPLAAARGYAEQHPELRVLVQELLDAVLHEKPEKPIELIRERFEREKSRRPKRREDTDPIERLLRRYARNRGNSTSQAAAPRPAGESRLRPT
jgi:hypothetical protein